MFTISLIALASLAADIGPRGLVLFHSCVLLRIAGALAFDDIVARQPGNIVLDPAGHGFLLLERFLEQGRNAALDGYLAEGEKGFVGGDFVILQRIVGKNLSEEIAIGRRDRANWGGGG